MKYSLKMLASMGFVLQALKMAAASGISWWLASRLQGSTYPVFAPLAALLCTQVTLADSVQKGAYRVLGVIVGVSIGGMIGRFFEIGILPILVAIFLGLVLSKILKLNAQITSQVGVSTLLVLDYGQMHGYMVERIGETMIGAAVAVLMNLAIRPPDTVQAARQKLGRTAHELAFLLYQLKAGSDEQNLSAGLAKARSIVQQIEKDYQDLQTSCESLRYTPFKKNERKEMKMLAGISNRLGHIAVQVRGIARSLLDLRSAGRFFFDFSGVLEATGQCIETFGHSITVVPDSGVDIKEVVEKTRRLQFQYFIENQQTATGLFVPEFGGIYTDIGRILDEIENKFPDTLDSWHSGKRAGDVYAGE